MKDWVWKFLDWFGKDLDPNEILNTDALTPGVR
jgi:hypothetical protein